MTVDKNRRVLVALGEADHPGGLPTLILGIPEGAWDHMKDGLTHTFDFTPLGIRCQALIFRGEDYDALIETITNAAKQTKIPVGGLANLGIKEPTKQ